MHPIEKRQGLFVGHMGHCIFKYLCGYWGYPCTCYHQWIYSLRRSWTTVHPIPIHEKVSKRVEDQITTLYTPAKLQKWENYNCFPSYMKSSHQKILNSLCVMEECAISSSNMLGNVFNMDHMISNVQTRGSELLNNLNPLGFVSREFIMISLALEYLAMAILMMVSLSILQLS